MLESAKIIVFLNFLCVVLCKLHGDLVPSVISTKDFALWENATVPFYVNNDHFDHEQTTQILTALSMFAFKTCIKFMPVMAPPTSEEVLVFQNPEAVRRCVIRARGHSVFRPHVLDLGYDCLKSPKIDMMIMKALGFTFEHNRINRDSYIEVLQENIEPGALDLFTKEDTLPMELRFLQYDINSVMHFDPREYSRNGHRTIIFKDPNVKQHRAGLTPTDLKKIEIVYGPQCRARDRQEKIELCQSYPGVARRKREANYGPSSPRSKREINEKELATKSLRVNPDITVPPTTEAPSNFKDLNVDDVVQQVIENAYTISTAALKNAKEKYCNGTQPTDQLKTGKVNSMPSTDVMRIVEAVNEYVQSTLDIALKNLTEFCAETDMKLYQRSRYCNPNWGTDPRCPFGYKSTKSGLPRWSTQHRPAVYLSTKNHGNNKVRHYGRSGNDTVDIKAETRTKRGVGNNTAVLNDQTGSLNAKEVVDVTAKINSKDLLEGKKLAESKDKEVKGKDTIKEGNTKVAEGKDEKGKSPKSKSPASKTDRRYNKQKKSNYRYDDDKSRSDTDLYVVKPPKKQRHYSDEVRTPVKEERPVRPEKRPRKERLRDVETENERYGESEKERDEPKRPKNVEPKRLKDESKIENDEEHRRPNEREQWEEPQEPRYSDQDSVEDRKRPMDIINEWKEGDKRTTKKRKQKLGYSIEHVKEEDIKTKKSKTHYSSEQEPDELPKTVKLNKANVEFYNERMWPDRTVWYMIQEDSTYDTNDMRRRIEEVNRILKKTTCVKLVEIQPRQVNKYEDYLVIDNSPDYVTGRVGGKQNFGSIELFRGDQHRQHTAMMVMAMLGFYFEVSRHDRDQYVRVHMRHVRPDKLHHFEMIRSDATLPVPYDYASATHPAWQFWRQLGHTGISTVATFKDNDPDGTLMKSLGQNEKLLSDIDIIKINSVYGIKCFKKRSNNALRMANETIDSSKD